MLASGEKQPSNAITKSPLCCSYPSAPWMGTRRDRERQEGRQLCPEALMSDCRQLAKGWQSSDFVERTTHGQLLSAPVIFVIYGLLSRGGEVVASYETDRGTDYRRGDLCSRLRRDLGEKPGKGLLVEGRPLSSREKRISFAGGRSGNVRLQTKKQYGKAFWASLLPLTDPIPKTEMPPELLGAHSNTWIMKPVWRERRNSVQRCFLGGDKLLRVSSVVPRLSSAEVCDRAGF